MAEKKNQHFVPQFYLRNFSNDGRSVAAYLLSSQRYIPVASIKDQCSKDYLYGKDSWLEETFSQLETGMARIVTRILATNRLPRRNSGDYARMLVFIGAQKGRTLGAGKDQNDLLKGMGEYLIPPIAESIGYPEAAEDLELELVEPIRSSLEVMAECAPMIMDMTMILLVNESGLGFITSDDPVVLYNLYMEDQLSGFLGLQSIGLQIFFPLSPTHMILLYDSHVYGLPKDTETFRVTDPKDVRELNRLMAVHARSVVYFDGRVTQSDEVLSTMASIRGKRVERRRNLQVFELAQSQVRPGEEVWVPSQRNRGPSLSDKGKAWPRRQLIVTETKGPNIGLNLSFMKVLRRARRRRQDALAHRQGRSPELGRAFSSYRNLRQNGSLPPRMTFADYLIHHRVLADLERSSPWEAG